MKKYLLALLLLTSVFAVAAETEFVQYTASDFNKYHTSQQWVKPYFGEGHHNNTVGQYIISLNVKEGSTVYLANYVSNYNLAGDSPIANIADYYDMTNIRPDNQPDNHYHYGYVIADKGENGNFKIDENGSYSVDHQESAIHWGTGEQIQVTYHDPNNSSNTQTTTGYKLGTFDKDAEIFLVMTPKGYEGTYVTSYEPLNEYDEIGNPNGLQSVLKSRQYNTYDQIGQTRMNFAVGPYDGGATGSSLEFVIGYVSEPLDPQPSGQPLPGVLSSCLIALGATGIAARRRKQSRK